MTLVMPLFALAIVLFGLIRRVAVFDLFLEGVREGLRTLRNIAPTLMGLTCATRMAEHPGRNLTLRAEGYPKIGLWGTRGHTDRPVRAAVFGAPDGCIRDIMKRVKC